MPVVPAQLMVNGVCSNLAGCECSEEYRGETCSSGEASSSMYCNSRFLLGYLGLRTRWPKDWDALRVQHSDALDNILESLGSQLVPPDFHQDASDSSLFGSQHSGDDHEPNGRATESPQLSPSATVRNVQKEKTGTDRKNWKTLRDFVDDRAIEDALETMENDRTALDVGIRDIWLWGKEVDVSCGLG